MKRRADGRTLRNDKRAVSPVIGVILMIAITVVIAAVVASFAYGIIGGVTKAPSAALVIENADAGNTNITVVHHGGDTISDAFKDMPTGNWSGIIIKRNGLDIDWTNNVTVGGDTDSSFESGEQLRIKVPTLVGGDTITVVYVPSGEILQRVRVA